MSSDFPFSQRTVGYLIEAIADAHTKTRLGTLLLKADVAEWEPDEWRNKEELVQGVFELLRYSGGERGVAGALELARLVMAEGDKEGTYRPDWWVPLRDVLAADGWEYDERRSVLVPTVPAASTASEVTWIASELHKRGWSVAAGHYEQAVENFADGNWAAANGQLRAFFESTITTATGRGGTKASGQVQVGADDLDSAGLLIPDEADFVKSLWKLLHPAGSHPGLSDQDESRFRLLALTGYVRFLLSRLP